MKKLITKLNLKLAKPAQDRGQVLIEYILMFVVICIAIIFAATRFIRPSVEHLFEDSGGVIEGMADDFVSGASSW